MNARTFLVFLAMLGCAAGAGAQQRSTSPAPAAETSATPVVTRHGVQVHGQRLDYSATVGTMPVKLATGAQADMSYVAYTSHPGQNRPITFLFNGGPGSASLWLDLGSFGPRRLETRSPQPTPAAPFHIVDNAETLLDTTDLVFIDAVGTGISRVREGTDANAFSGVDPDLESFADFIATYLTQNDRWASPKFILGESYGATRAAALAHVLQRRGASPNGVILLSSILNFSSYHPGIDRGFLNTLPTMAATAWYHHRAGRDAPDLPTFVQQARDFAGGDYADALQLGDRLPAEREAAIRAKLAAFTGLSPDDLRRTGLRIDVGQFAKLLLGGGRAVGIYDTRASAEDTDAAAQSPSFDPADTVVANVFPAANLAYLTQELGYRSTEPYRATVPGLPNRWDWSHAAPGMSDRLTSPAMEFDLSAAMHEDPTLRVLSLNGYYDLGTPFFGTEYDLAHMRLGPAIRPNLTFRHYPAGHMLYLDGAVRAATARDIRAWIATTLEARP
ncbi:S10 family peptidase [Sphingomonas sp. MMS12-HWE2-04]|uniref:S10 family peptidase n=1 Tax=Sphingomonas sp. MMS12-HWE2-04 TaxID=3234199 RepID=UPI00384E042B